MHTKRDNYVLSSAALGEDDANANQFEIFKAFDFVIAGRTYSKALTAALTFTAGHTALAANQMCAFFVLIDAAGTITTEQSTIVPAPAATGYVPGAWEWPDPPTKAVVGAIVVRTGATTFTPNSTDLGAANVTDTYVNATTDYGQPITY